MLCVFGSSFGFILEKLSSYWANKMKWRINTEHNKRTRKRQRKNKWMVFCGAFDAIMSFMWCKSCEAEMKQWNEMLKKIWKNGQKKKGFKIFFIYWSDGWWFGWFSDQCWPFQMFVIYWVEIIPIIDTQNSLTQKKTTVKLASVIFVTIHFLDALNSFRLFFFLSVSVKWHPIWSVWLYRHPFFLFRS